MFYGQTWCRELLWDSYLLATPSTICNIGIQTHPDDGMYLHLRYLISNMLHIENYYHSYCFISISDSSVNNHSETKQWYVCSYITLLSCNSAFAHLHMLSCWHEESWTYLQVNKNPIPKVFFLLQRYSCHIIITLMQLFVCIYLYVNNVDQMTRSVFHQKLHAP